MFFELFNKYFLGGKNEKSPDEILSDPLKSIGNE